MLPAILFGRRLTSAVRGLFWQEPAAAGRGPPTGKGVAMRAKPPAQPPPRDRAARPVEKILAGVSDPAVRQWLSALLGKGESASSSTPPAATKDTGQAQS
jgi:hypothetical protein